MAVTRMVPSLSKLQSIIGYKAKNAQHLWEALQAPGAIVRSGETSELASERHSVGHVRLPDGHRRLADVGDAALKLALVEEWYKGEGNRQRLNRILADVAGNDNLNRIGHQHNLDQLINQNPSQSGGCVSPNTMADSVEAILGAVFLDGGMEAVPTVMESLGLIPKLVRRPKFSKIKTSPPVTDEHETSSS